MDQFSDGQDEAHGSQYLLDDILAFSKLLIYVFRMTSHAWGNCDFCVSSVIVAVHICGPDIGPLFESANYI